MTVQKFILSLIPLLYGLSALASPPVPAEITVTDGASLHAALREVREWRRTGDARCLDGVTIRLRAGRYYMSEPLFLRPEDSGSPSSPTIIRGDSGAVLCGDPVQRHVRLWPRDGMERLLGFDTERRTIAIPTPPMPFDDNGRAMPMPAAQRATAHSHMGDFGSGLEMVVCQRWAMAILRVKEMTRHGDSTVVTFLEPESRLEFDHPWPQPVIGGEKGSSAFMLRSTEQRDGIERLVVIGGADGHRVSNVCFEDVTFEHTCWNRPLHRGHVTLQGGLPLVDAYKLKGHEGLPWDDRLENQAWVERPVAAVSVSSASQVSFRRCTFRKLGSTALDFIDDTDSCTVDQCTFTGIGGAAVMAGSFAESPREAHRPYDGLAQRCRRLTISACNISRASAEDWGAPAIACGYVSDTNISGNTVTEVNYSGICVGWGWTAAETGMERNHIYNNNVTDYARQLYDAGGIYTLSNQPGSTIRDNTIGAPANAPYATNDRAFRIYLDARTDGYTISGNIAAETATPIDTHDIGYNHPGPHIVNCNIVHRQDNGH